MPLTAVEIAVASEELREFHGRRHRAVDGLEPVEMESVWLSHLG